METQQQTRPSGITVTETVRTRTVPADRSYLLVAPVDWSAEHLREYVIDQIQMRFDMPKRNPATETAIFRRFHKQWQGAAGPIAEYAFEVCNGFWRSGKIDVNRFCANSDKYFAIPILKKLAESA